MKYLALFWKKWLPIAQAIGNFQGQLILTLFYFLILWPAGLFFRLLRDPFDLRKVKGSNFSKWEHAREDLERARKQY